MLEKPATFSTCPRFIFSFFRLQFFASMRPFIYILNHFLTVWTLLKTFMDYLVMLDDEFIVLECQTTIAVLVILFYVTIHVFFMLIFSL